MKKIILLILIFCFTSIVFSSESEESILLTKIDNKENSYVIDNYFYVYVSNIGKDTSVLKVNINGKDYSVEEAYGNHIKIKVTSEMTSGQLYVKKNITKNTETVTIESNRMDIDFDEPSISKVEAINGLIPDEILRVSGKNLDSSNFWCGTNALTIKTRTDELVDLIIPNLFLDCEIEIKKNGFILKVNKKLTLKAYPTFSSISLEDKYYYLKGKNFFQFKDNLSDISLDIEGIKISSPEIVSDEQIRFPKTEGIKSIGVAKLSVLEDILPPVSYNFNIDVPYVTKITPLSYINGEFQYIVTFNELVSKILIEGKIYKDNSELKGDIFKDSITVKPGSVINGESEFWVTKDGIKGAIFKHNFNVDFSPVIEKIQAASKILKSGGTLVITGYGFVPKDSVSISTSLGDFEIKKIDATSITAMFTNKADVNGLVGLTVKSDFGTSNSVNVEVGAEKLTVFYAKPIITSIEYPDGPFVKKTMEINGKILDRVGYVKFGEKTYKPSKKYSAYILITISSDFEKSGNISLVTYDNISSDSKPYEFYDKPDKEEIKIIINKDNKKYDLINDGNYQTLMEFGILNTKSYRELSFDILMENVKEYSPVFPFSDFKLVDADKKEIDNVEITFDTENKKIYIKNLVSDPSLEVLEYSLQGKISESFKKSDSRIIGLLEVMAKDNNDKKNEVQFDADKITINISEKGLDQFCTEYNENKWGDCILKESEISKEDSDKLLKTEENDAKNVEENSEVVEEIKTDVNEEEDKKTENLEMTSKKDNDKINNQVPSKNDNQKMYFKDISKEDWFFPYVKDLYQRGIINGYADGNFNPGGNLNRAELVKMILLARSEKWGTYGTVNFGDTENHWAKDLLEYALEKGYIKKSKKFQPLKEVTRAETIKLMSKMFTIFDIKDTDTHFTDLENHWAKNYVMAAYDLGIIKGVTETTFEPDKLITRAEFSKILGKVIELSE